MLNQITFQNAQDATSLTASCVTIVVGLIGIIGLLLKRKEISRLLSLVASAHLRERVNRIKETLGRLEGMNYNNKEERAEIIALVGQLQGQLQGLDSHEEGIVTTLDEISQYSQPGNRLSEAKKRTLVYSVHGNLDNILHNGSKTLIKK